MKTYKKILLGLILPVGLGVFFLLGGKALAFTESELQSATYTPITQGDLIIGFDVTIGNQTIRFIDQDPFGFPDNAKAASGPRVNEFCANTRLGASGGKGITYTNDDSAIIQAGGVPVSVNLDYNNLSNPGGGCQTFTKTFVINAQNPGGGGTPTEGDTCPTNGETSGDLTCVCTVEGTTNPVETCEWVGSSGGEGDSLSACLTISNPFSWAVCPILGMVDSVVKKLYDSIQNRLCIATNYNETGNLTAGAKDAKNRCEGESFLNDAAKSAWSSFRVIATSLLVIAMLFGIIGQAVGSGRSG